MDDPLSLSYTIARDFGFNDDIVLKNIHQALNYYEFYILFQLNKIYGYQNALLPSI